jgi:hypothetical protein
MTCMKRTCGLCPFSRTKTLFLHPERTVAFATMAADRFGDFPCHKTADYDEDDDGWGRYVHGERSHTCHGFATLQAALTGYQPEGFTPDGDGFTSVDEMIARHGELWADQQRRRMVKHET